MAFAIPAFPGVYFIPAQGGTGTSLNGITSGTLLPNEAFNLYYNSGLNGTLRTNIKAFNNQFKGDMNGYLYGYGVVSGANLNALPAGGFLANIAASESPYCFLGVKHPLTSAGVNSGYEDATVALGAASNLAQTSGTATDGTTNNPLSYRNYDWLFDVQYNPANVGSEFQITIGGGFGKILTTAPPTGTYAAGVRRFNVKNSTTPPVVLYQTSATGTNLVNNFPNLDATPVFSQPFDVFAPCNAPTQVNAVYNPTANTVVLNWNTPCIFNLDWAPPDIANPVYNNLVTGGGPTNTFTLVNARAAIPGIAIGQTPNFRLTCLCNLSGTNYFNVQFIVPMIRAIANLPRQHQFRR